MKFLTIAFLISLFTTGLHGKEYGLKVGEKAPDFQVTLSDGSPFQLSKQLEEKPVVLVFYRGGWCPYCNLQLQALSKDTKSLSEGDNVLILAISVDRMDEAAKTKGDLLFPVASDPEAKTLELFNIVNKVPMELVKKYKDKYKIDLEAASGQSHHKIAVPAVFAINKKSEITYAYANENYKVRAQNSDVINAIKMLAKDK